ncbi:hypothetical protein T492DRAFT_162934 [Pavlovales sp. CCMP2436]|nr:hypothetical protein T492DRAFT_162934 [Pavlovales sp. CCMP2436]
MTPAWSRRMELGALLLLLCTSPAHAIRCHTGSYGEPLQLGQCPTEQPSCFTMSYMVRASLTDPWSTPAEPCLAGCAHWTWKLVYPEVMSSVRGSQCTVQSTCITSTVCLCLSQ